MDCDKLKSRLQCRSCSTVIEELISNDDLAAIVCRHCGTLQNKEQTVFEAAPNMIFPSRNVGCENSYTLKRFIAKTSTITNTLNLPHHLTEKVIELAKRMFQDNVLKKQKSGSKMAACIHYVTRSHGYAIPIKKLSSATQTPLNSISKCLNLCVRRLQLEPLPYLDYMSFLERYSEGVANESRGIVIEWSKGIDAIVGATTDGSSPAVAAAALLKVVLEGRNTPFNFASICNQFSISYQAIRSIASKVRKKLFLFSQQIPWKPSTLTESNVASFLPEILKYHAQFMQGSNAHQLGNDAPCFKDIVKLALEIKSESRKSDTRRQNDPVFCIIWDLLDKGCPEEDILSQNLSALSREYLDCTIDSNWYDCEIPDEEIDELLKDEEIDELYK